MEYAKRASLFEKGEQTWTVTPDSLVWTRPGGHPDSLDWRDVTHVRLGFEPTRFKRNRHVLSLTARSSQRWSIDSVHFAGVGNFEDRTDLFRPFVLACVERIAALEPGATARLGASTGAYWSQLLFVSVMFMVLAMVLILLPTPLGAVIWVKIAILLVSLPLPFRWAHRAWPRRTRLDPEAFRAALP